MKPFFLYLTYNAVHAPLEATQKYLDRFTSIKDEKRRTHAAMLAAMDDGGGAVVAKLSKEKLAENTLVFYISDNGGPTPQTTSSNAPLRGFKGQVYEGGVRIPFMAQWPGQIPAGKTYDQPVISLDMFATAVAAAGAKPPEKPLDGVDLLPHVTGKKDTPPHEALYWRFGQQHAVRRANHKLLRGPQEANDQLYDLAADISETKDLAADKADVAKELKDLYAKWDSQLVAPLWRGGGAGGVGPRTRPNGRGRANV